MQLGTKQGTRRGSILPFLALSLVAICGFTALAVDIGMIVAAKGQCQNAADAAAMAGARTVDGSPSANLTAATANAQAAAQANVVLGQNVKAGEVAITHGTYHYDPSALTFSPAFPPFPTVTGFPTDNFNLTKATVTHTVQYAFARVFNLTSMNVSATAIAAHRPRDVAIVLDYSGSMNNESDLWNNETYLGTANNSSNNTDPVFPQWGWYDPSYSPLASLQCTSFDPRVGKCNVTQSVLGIPAMVTNYYQNSRGNSAQAAFSPAPGTVTSTNPGGDLPLKKYDGSTVAKTWGEVWGAGTPPAGTVFDAYTARGTFYGYTQGPGYWGKTFFIWPPNPRNDWRENYFMLTGGAYPSFGGKLNDNTKLYSSSGVLNDPPGNYVINYAAILNFIKNVGPNPFPPQLRAGNILYYSSIPDDIQSSAYDHTQSNSAITDRNQRFWKEYIDFTLGVWRDLYGNIQHPGTPSCSYGPDFTPGTSTGGQYIQVKGPTTSYKDPNGDSFIDPSDNPKRPRHRLWFGPMTLIQYLSDTGLFPGTASDISMVAAKLGIQGALTDIQTNHPNDVVSMLLFSRPSYMGEPPGVGAFSVPQYNLSRDYNGMINSLWFPPNSSTSDVGPWDTNGAQTPRAHGDYNSNTATSYGFMLAYNQFSSQASLRSAGSNGSPLGGFGRKGSQRLVVLETDGMANVSTQQSFNNQGPYNSYYSLTPGQLQTTSNAPDQDAIQVVTRMCALTTDNANGPGFALPNKPVVVHCLAFGAVFEPTAAGSEASTAMAMLQQISQIGGTGFPSSVTATGDPNYYKLCIGTLTERQQKLRTAFSKIMDDGISVVMVK
jgi:Putative Flp pilus-assembly TadE/G-like